MSTFNTCCAKVTCTNTTNTRGYRYKQCLLKKILEGEKQGTTLCTLNSLYSTVQVRHRSSVYKIAEGREASFGWQAGCSLETPTRARVSPTTSLCYTFIRQLWREWKPLVSLSNKKFIKGQLDSGTVVRSMHFQGQGLHTKVPKKNHACRDFPGGAVVKNPPANAGDTGSSPGPGRFHRLRST